MNPLIKTITKKLKLADSAKVRFGTNHNFAIEQQQDGQNELVSVVLYPKHSTQLVLSLVAKTNCAEVLASACYDLLENQNVNTLGELQLKLNIPNKTWNTNILHRFSLQK